MSSGAPVQPTTPPPALPTLPPAALHPEVEAWINANQLGEFLPYIRDAGFSDLDSVSTITEADAEAMGISQLGARRRLVRAIQRLAASLPPSNIPHPHLTPTRPLLDSSGMLATSPYGLRLGASPDDTDEDGTPKKRRGPMRCGKCHQWKKQCHGHCTVRCTSFDTCPTQHKRAHPELKELEREHRRREDDERKRKRDEEKEEKRREKKVREEQGVLIPGAHHVLPPPPHHQEVVLENGERVLISDKDVADASEVVAASLHHAVHHQPV